MIFRILIFAIIIGVILYFIRAYGNQEYRKCGKCEGRGYWKGLRGEKEKCDICKGSGKVQNR